MTQILAATSNAATSTLVDVASGGVATIGIIPPAAGLDSFSGECAVEILAATGLWSPVGKLTKHVAALNVSAPGAEITVRASKEFTRDAIGFFAIGGTPQE